MDKNRYQQPLIFRVGFLFAIFILIISVWPLAYVWAESLGPLTISDLKVSAVSNGTVSISWTTNKPSDSYVEYSPDLNYGQKKAIKEFYRERSIILDDVLPDSIYHYQVRSTTADGETVTSAHFDFYSFRAADLEISTLDFQPSFHQFASFPPVIANGALTLKIKNSGQVDINKDFFLSLIITNVNTQASSTEEQAKNEDQSISSYSCFLDTLVSGGILAEQEKNLVFPADALTNCDPLSSGDYTITAAVDYDNEVLEANEDNNVVSSNFIVEPVEQAPKFINLQTEDMTASSTVATFSLAGTWNGSEVTVQVAPAYYSGWLWSQSSSFATSTYSALLEGLKQETEYNWRLSVSNTNAYSETASFMTLKDLNADVNELMARKLANPDCRLVTSQPLATTYWQDLGLALPEVNFTRYRILWSGGNWSPWYLPGSGDEDWVKNGAGQERRVWSYFENHVFQYETCSSEKGLLSVESDQATSAEPRVTDKYDHLIDRKLELTDARLQRLKQNFDQALRYYKSFVSDKNWVVLRDAYMYGGYHLTEIEQTIVFGPGPVHPTIPAITWRAQYATVELPVRLSFNNN